MEKNQNTDPFKFIIYSARIGEQTPQINAERAKRFAYLKLMEKNQNTDPFKFIIYSGKIGEQTPQINAGHPK